MTVATAAATGGAETRKRPARVTAGRLRALGMYTLSVLVGLAVWQALAMAYGSSLVASPS